MLTTLLSAGSIAWPIGPPDLAAIARQIRNMLGVLKRLHIDWLDGFVLHDCLVGCGFFI